MEGRGQTLCHQKTDSCLTDCHGCLGGKLRYLHTKVTVEGGSVLHEGTEVEVVDASGPAVHLQRSSVAGNSSVSPAKILGAS